MDEHAFRYCLPAGDHTSLPPMSGCPPDIGTTEYPGTRFPSPATPPPPDISTSSGNDLTLRSAAVNIPRRHTSFGRNSGPSCSCRSCPKSHEASNTADPPSSATDDELETYSTCKILRRFKRDVRLSLWHARKKEMALEKTRLHQQKADRHRELQHHYRDRLNKWIILDTDARSSRIYTDQTSCPATSFDELWSNATSEFRRSRSSSNKK